MATRLQVLVPVAAAAVIVGVAGMLSIPADTKMDFCPSFPGGRYAWTRPYLRCR